MANGPKATTATMISCMSYTDANAAIEWLGKAFGFKPHMVYRDDAGAVVHAELSFGSGMMMLGPASKGDFGKEFIIQPKNAQGRCTQTVYVIVDDVDAHHDRAKTAGAEIVRPPKDEDYGGRVYSARDPEGHVWTFGNYDPWASRSG